MYNEHIIKDKDLLDLRSICWDITSRCNEQCGFCYRNVQATDLDYESNIIILKKLLDFGVNKISFVGGEPLLYPYLFDLVKLARAYDKRKRTLYSITTNAILLATVEENKLVVNEKLLEKVSENFDWITFSLDAPNNELQHIMGRNQQHYTRVQGILKYLNDNKIKNKVKINTVVSKININSLEELYYDLVNHNVKRWKVFRFLPSRGSALNCKDKYFIDEKSYLDAVQKILLINSQMEKKKQMKITVNGFDSFNNSYITISSEGKFVVYDGEKYNNVLNLLTEDISRIFLYIDVNKHQNLRSEFVNL